MRIAVYIVLALSYGIVDTLLFRRSAQATPVALSRGLLIALFSSVIQVCMFFIGMAIGELLRFELPNGADAFVRANAFVFIGLDAIVIVRLWVPYLYRKKEPVLFSLASFLAVCSLAVVSGINLFLLGLGMGFITSLSANFSPAGWVLLIVLFLASYWGLMLGRRGVSVRPHRWMLLVSLFLVGIAVAVAVRMV